MLTPLHLHLWAKSDPQHPLWCHLLDVAAVCEALLPRFGGVENLEGVEEIPKPWLLLLVALHDIGKADAQFQNKDPQQKARIEGLGLELWPEVTRFRHEARSADWLGAFYMSGDGGEKLARSSPARSGAIMATLQPAKTEVMENFTTKVRCPSILPAGILCAMPWPL